MKRFIALVACLAVVLGLVPVIAQESGEMEAALIAVKNKVDVPEGLSEFDSESYNYDGKNTYHFSWSDEERTAAINVNCDDKGRISSYNYYSQDMYHRSESNILATVTKEQVLRFAGVFISKLLPETTGGESDVLVYDANNVRASVSEMGTRYYISYKRCKNGIPVDGNVATVTILAVGDEMVVTNAYCSYDYDTPFKTEEERAVYQKEEAYRQYFPEELVYVKDYDDKGKMHTKLVYRFKDDNVGYITDASGEIIEKDSNTYGEVYKETLAEDSVAVNSAAGGLTRQEISELNSIAGLKSAEEIERMLRSMGELNVTKVMTVQSTNVYKQGDAYYMHINLCSDDGRDLNVTVDAATGEVKDIYNYDRLNGEKDVSDVQKKTAENVMDGFVKRIGGEDFSLCKDGDIEAYGMLVSKTYHRYENDVPVIGEEITVSYDVENQRVRSYSNYIDNSLMLESTDGVAESATAYAYLINAAPIEHIYIKSGGEYVLCYSANENQNVRIDAKTGQVYDPYGEKDDDTAFYDIDKHWCKAAVEKLVEVGIKLPGDKFNPETDINQEELLRMFAAGFNYSYFMTSPVDDLYRELYSMGILTKEERNEAATVKREDAIVYMIRFAQLERIAKLNKIFTVDFKDAADITNEKLGHAAILWGMGIVGGDDEGLRPQDSITRAEAAVMLYKYLTSASK